MLRTGPRRSGFAALCVLATLVTLATWSGRAAAQLGEGEVSSDDAFIESLAQDTRQPVDRRRLARLLFSVSANLDGGKSSVRLLQSKVSVPPPARPTARTLLEAGYEAYTRYLGQFQQRVSRLLDDPDSTPLLYETLASGQRTCWQLDQHTRTLDGYGVDGADLLSALSSLEACARFRKATFQPRVESIVANALSEPARNREEIRALQEEVRDLERLVEELRRIDQNE